MLATLSVTASVVWQWRETPRKLAPLKVPAALLLPDTVKPYASSTSKVLSTVVVRSASNLHSPADALALAKHLKSAGVQRVWVQFKQDETDEFEGGVVFYPSKLAPVANGFDDGRLMTFVNELHSAGIKVAAWLPALHDPTAWKAHPAWRSQWINEQGSLEEQHGWLCPRHPDAVAYEASLLAEVAALCHDKLAGIYTDFIRYDDDFACACERCMKELAHGSQDRPVTPKQLRSESIGQGPLWDAWIEQRGDAIHDALNEMRDALTNVAPGIWFGASVLPFSALDYELNSQSGQDLKMMCRAGVDEILLMGYWDDWDESPEWLSASIKHAQELVGDEARLSCLLDADMSVRRTMKTLDTVRDTGCELAWFNYGTWDQTTIGRLQRADDQLQVHGGMPRAPFTAVTLRIDTEPDAHGRYDTVQPAMIDSLVAMFAEEQIKATFVTCGRLAEQQPESIRRAFAAGHEIAGHAYNHEQLDSLSALDQALIIDRMVGSFAALNIPLAGFGAPRNSITDQARNRLVEHGLFYDGSEAYDPLKSYMDPQIATHTDDGSNGIVVLPFIVPNDWDARYLLKLSAAEMQQAWNERLAKVADAGEPCFIIDIHQWIASQPDNLEAVRQFIRSVKARPDCRLMTLNDTAHHVLNELQRAEGTLLARP